MITAKKVIQNLQEIKDFCNAQVKCQSCPFMAHGMGSFCTIKENMRDWNGDTLYPSEWELEEINYEEG